ncbi:hypothetical protein Leryth_023570 [Lithospermum erythrorhizon]|nr:hypothetical protein Leryth_023570 [Lithospermum erythrorhizon]
MAVADEETSSSSNTSATKLRSDAAASCYLAKTVLRSSVVLQVVQAHFRTQSTNDVVFGKETTIELVVIGEDGIVQSICEQPVFGIIKDLAVLRWSERFDCEQSQATGKDILVVISDSGKLSFLTFCNEMHRFFAITHIPLSISGNSRNQLGRMLSIDSNGCFIAVSAYEDRLALFSISSSAGSDIIDKRIFYPPENKVEASASGGGIRGTIWSMCFISKEFHQSSKENNPVLAILLNREKSYRNELLVMEWDTKEHVVHVVYKHSEAGPLAHQIVEVPRSFGFAFLFRAGDALLMDFRDVQNPCCVKKISLSFTPSPVEAQSFLEARSSKLPDIIDDSVAASALLELSDIYKNDSMDIDGDIAIEPGSNFVCSWCWGDQDMNNRMMIFCADSGEIFRIEISLDSDGAKVKLSDRLFKCQPTKALLWVEGGFVAAIVEMGDGMVLKLEEDRLVYQSAIQNIAPILDMSVADYHDEKHDQMFSCCGISPGGSLRIIRSGISVDKLLKTAPVYRGITGLWTVNMKLSDSYNSFLVVAFVEETRVLSVGVNFRDVTDFVGFLSDVCTLACGLVSDDLLVQIHQCGVRICMPTSAAHPEGIQSSWSPSNNSISLGAVGENMIVVATSTPCSLFVLGVKCESAFHYEVYQMQQVMLEHELSCISIPPKHLEQEATNFFSNAAHSTQVSSVLAGIDTNSIFVIGTHKPSVEVLSFDRNKGLRVLAIGIISITSTMGSTISGCIPQDVRIVLVDRLYVLSGLRNGMLLRYEWPSASVMYPSGSAGQQAMNGSYLVNTISSPNTAFTNYRGHPMSGINDTEKSNEDCPTNLQLIAVRRIGITPAFLVPLNNFLDADIIILSDRPWLLQTARHSISYTSISFQPSTHVTPVCSMECPKGILFVSESSLHLVEMIHSKRLNVQKFHLGGTPRKILYHRESRLLVVMRTELDNDSHSSDVCCIDPLSGSVVSSFRFEPGETGKCMELMKIRNEHVLVVGTSLSAGPAIMPSGEAESTKGRLLVLCLEHPQNSDSGSMTLGSKAGSSSRSSPFREAGGYSGDQLSGSSICSSPDDNSCDGFKLEDNEAWNMRLAYSTIWPGMVLAVCAYLDHYFLASAGSSFYVCSFPNDNSQRVRRLAVGRTRFMIMALSTHFTRIAVGDCRDGILFYSYHEDARKLEQLYCDPVQRLVADCILIDVDTAVVSDRKGTIAVLSSSNHLEDNVSPECNLSISCSYYMGEIAMSIERGSFSYKLPTDDVLKSSHISSAITDLSENSIMASTLLGSIVTFIPLSRDEYELLEEVQAKVAIHPLTSPILGNDHKEFRARESLARVPKMLDGDLLSQFLELTNMQQEAVLSVPLGSQNTIMLISKPSARITVNQVVRLLERVHNSLN